MKILKFTISGDNAFFKKPEVNTYFYFTYSCIHKVALLGILGAIMGYGGYRQTDKKDSYPEFYEKFNGIKLSVVPRSKNGYFAKKIQYFNNSVGYASKEQGGNLIVKEQWLENPSWDIYIQVVDEASEKLADQILKRRCVFIPYLGKNDHFADITGVELLEGLINNNKCGFIHSIAPQSWLELDLEEQKYEIARPFKYEEYLPLSLDEKTHLYKTELFIFTNFGILGAQCEIVFVDKRNIVFF